MSNLRKMCFIPCTALLLAFSSGSLMAESRSARPPQERPTPPVMPPFIGPRSSPELAQKKVEPVKAPATAEAKRPGNVKE